MILCINCNKPVTATKEGHVCKKEAKLKWKMLRLRKRKGK